MDIASISAALAGIKSATEIAKIIKDSGASLEQAEIRLKLADLISALADAKIEIANIREVVSDKESEIKDLYKKLDLNFRTYQRCSNGLKLHRSFTIYRTEAATNAAKGRGFLS